ncbi:FAS-associated death domain protein-like [Branchiostoma floridae x Branchiostoma japonicum]
MNQRDADKMEIKRLKEQVASLSTEITCLYAMSRDIINNIHFEDMGDRDGTEGDTDVSRHFYYIKENVTAEWKDLAYQLGFTRPDIDTIDDRNKDYKSRCLDMLGEWQKREGEVATVAVLMEALRELGLTSVVDGLKSKYPGSLLSTQCSG